MSQPLEQENITYNASDGALFGATSTKKIGFYGSTPVARSVTASSNSVSTASTISLSTAGGSASTIWGFASQAEANNFTVAVSTLQYAMKQLGIMA
jgi:hypothetical protein